MLCNRRLTQRIEMLGSTVSAMLLALFVLAALASPALAGGYKRGQGKTHEEKQAAINVSAIYTGATARPSPVRSLSALPLHFDWCDVDSKSYCTASWNQHIPKYCGSCWIHGALGAANDRIKVLMDGRHDVMLARQVLLNCAQSKGLGAGCDGGESFDVFEYMHRYGLPDESCANYVAESSAVCDQQAICSNCMPIGEEAIWPYRCWAVPSPILFYVHEYGQVHGEAAMMSEIHARGPITCGFASVDDFDYNYRGGVYVDSTNATEMNHDVEVVGWGEENGLKYWKARNSWGTYWGENGFFRIQRGTNNMQFESDCVFALFDTHHLQDVLRGKMGGSMFGIVQQHDKILNLTSKGNPHVRHHNPNREAEKEGRRAEKLEAEEEEEEEEAKEDRRKADKASGFSHSHGHNHGHQPRGGGKHSLEGKEVKSSHFGGEPTLRRSNERLLAEDASEQFSAFSTAYAESDDEAERQAETSIMDAIRAAYQREQTRKRTPSHSDNNQKVDSEEKEGRAKDQNDIALAIHHALKAIDDRDAVKGIVLRCLQRLEDEEADEVAAAEAAGADGEAVREEKDRDVRIVEEETGRMWRQQAANQTSEEVTDSIQKFIDGLKERGEKVVSSLSPRDDTVDAQLLADERESASEADRRGESEAGMSGQHLMFGVLVGVVLGVMACLAATYLWMKHKERNDYLEL